MATAPQRAGRRSGGGLGHSSSRRRLVDPVRIGSRAGVLGLMALAVAVQVFVWGSASTGAGGALLPGLRPDFGTVYATALLLVELGVCLTCGLGEVAVWVLGAGAGVDLVFWVAHVAGSHFALGAAAAMTAAFGSVALNAGIWRRAGGLEPSR